MRAGGLPLRHRTVAAHAAVGLRRAVPRSPAPRWPTRSTLRRLDPQLRHRWPDGSGFDTLDGPEATAAAIERFSPGAGEAYRRFDARGARVWEVGRRTFLAGPMTGGPALLKRCARPGTCARSIRCARWIAAARAAFTDPRLVQWAGRYATYSGSSRPGARRPRWPASPPSRPATGSGTRRAAWVRCGTLSSASPSTAGWTSPTGAEVGAIEAGRRRGPRCAHGRPASGTAPTSWSPTSTPSTSTATSCRSPARSAAPRGRGARCPAS